LFSLYLCRYPNQNNFSKLKQFFINLISETCVIKETSEYELVRVHFLLSLCNFGEHLKVKSCYYVEVYAFKVFFYNYFHKMREYSGESDDKHSQLLFYKEFIFYFLYF
jgi:hypothetical protein